MAVVETVEKTDTSTKVAMRAPGMFNVVLFNDDSTTVEFVILILMNIFHKNIDDASALTLQIHETGRGIAGTYSHEVATQKRDETVLSARTNSFPLRCEIEPA